MLLTAFAGIIDEGLAKQVGNKLVVNKAAKKWLSRIALNHFEDHSKLEREMDRRRWLCYAQGMPEDDPLQRQPIIERAQKELGWEPKVALQDGLQPTIAWFRKTLNS